MPYWAGVGKQVNRWAPGWAGDAVESFREGESILAVPSPLVAPVNEPYLILPSESSHSQARGHVRKPCAQKPCGHVGAGWPTAPQWADGGLAQGGWRCGQCDLVELAGWLLGRRDSCPSWLRGPTGLSEAWPPVGMLWAYCWPLLSGMSVISGPETALVMLGPAVWVRLRPSSGTWASCSQPGAEGTEALPTSSLPLVPMIPRWGSQSLWDRVGRPRGWTWKSRYGLGCECFKHEAGDHSQECA